MSHIIRYVRCSQTECSIEESFIDFIKITGKTGDAMANQITSKLVDDGLNIDDIRGQASMAEKYSGVQAKILNLNKFARFVPCSAHSLSCS